MHKSLIIGLILLATSFCFGECPQYDLTGDCWVGLEDLAALASEWMTGSRNKVPYLLEMDQEAATRAIIAAGLTVGHIDFQFSASVNEGYVISQEPAGNKLIAAQDKVSIIIAIGLNRLYPDITWVLIDDSGAGMKDINGEPINQGGFSGYMSKYETTNAQYCRFLNQALSSGDIEVGEEADGLYVRDAESGEHYYYLDGIGANKDSAIDGGAARINYSFDSKEFTVDKFFENHPVTYVSWYGANAFAERYGWRLPTEWEWQAVADYDGSYEWGCGPIIDNSKANYSGSIHLVGTTPVGHFGTYGYGLCDMTGNLGEWTSSYYAAGVRTIRDNHWGSLAFYCRVVMRPHAVPSLCGYNIGFRVVMD